MYLLLLATLAAASRNWYSRGVVDADARLMSDQILFLYESRWLNLQRVRHPEVW